MDSIQNIVKQIMGLLNSASEDYKRLRAELSQVDLSQQDILHIIENGNFSAFQGYYYAKTLQNIRQKRRKIKNDIELYQILSSFILKYEKDLDKVNKNIELKYNQQLNNTLLLKTNCPELENIKKAISN